MSVWQAFTTIGTVVGRKVVEGVKQTVGGEDENHEEHAFDIEVPEDKPISGVGANSNVTSGNSNSTMGNSNSPSFFPTSIQNAVQNAVKSNISRFGLTSAKLVSDGGSLRRFDAPSLNPKSESNDYVLEIQYLENIASKPGAPIAIWGELISTDQMDFSFEVNDPNLSAVLPRLCWRTVFFYSKALETVFLNIHKTNDDIIDNLLLLAVDCDLDWTLLRNLRESVIEKIIIQRVFSPNTYAVMNATANPVVPGASKSGSANSSPTVLVNNSSPSEALVTESMTEVKSPTGKNKLHVANGIILLEGDASPSVSEMSPSPNKPREKQRESPTTDLSSDGTTAGLSAKGEISMTVIGINSTSVTGTEASTSVAATENTKKDSTIDPSVTAETPVTAESSLRQPDTAEKTPIVSMEGTISNSEMKLVDHDSIDNIVASTNVADKLDRASLPRPQTFENVNFLAAQVGVDIERMMDRFLGLVKCDPLIDGLGWRRFMLITAAQEKEKQRDWVLSIVEEKGILESYSERGKSSKGKGQHEGSLPRRDNSGNQDPNGESFAAYANAVMEGLAESAFADDGDYTYRDVQQMNSTIFDEYNKCRDTMTQEYFRFEIRKEEIRTGFGKLRSKCENLIELVPKYETQIEKEVVDLTDKFEKVTKKAKDFERDLVSQSFTVGGKEGSAIPAEEEGDGVSISEEARKQIEGNRREIEENRKNEEYIQDLEAELERKKEEMEKLSRMIGEKKREKEELARKKERRLERHTEYCQNLNKKNVKSFFALTKFEVVSVNNETTVKLGEQNEYAEEKADDITNTQKSKEPTKVEDNDLHAGHEGISEEEVKKTLISVSDNILLAIYHHNRIIGFYRDRQKKKTNGNGEKNGNRFEYTNGEKNGHSSMKMMSMCEKYLKILGTKPNCNNKAKHNKALMLLKSKYPEKYEVLYMMMSGDDPDQRLYHEAPNYLLALTIPGLTLSTQSEVLAGALAEELELIRYGLEHLEFNAEKVLETDSLLKTCLRHKLEKEMQMGVVDPQTGLQMGIESEALEEGNSANPETTNESEPKQTTEKYVCTGIPEFEGLTINAKSVITPGLQEVYAGLVIEERKLRNFILYSERNFETSWMESEANFQNAVGVSLAIRMADVQQALKDRQQEQVANNNDSSEEETEPVASKAVENTNVTAENVENADATDNKDLSKDIGSPRSALVFEKAVQFLTFPIVKTKWDALLKRRSDVYLRMSQRTPL